MKSEILVIAEAVLANIRVLEMLIHKLPDADRVAVAQVVNATPATVTIATPAPAPVVATPAAPTPAPIPAAPVVVETAPAAPAPASPSKPVPVPFTSQKELITYVMGAYKALGPNGDKIQEVLNTVGVKNINDVQPAMYKALFDGIEALK